MTLPHMLSEVCDNHDRQKDRLMDGRGRGIKIQDFENAVSQRLQTIKHHIYTAVAKPWNHIDKASFTKSKIFKRNQSSLKYLIKQKSMFSQMFTLKRNQRFLKCLL